MPTFFFKFDLQPDYTSLFPLSQAKRHFHSRTRHGIRVCLRYHLWRSLRFTSTGRGSLSPRESASLSAGSCTQEPGWLPPGSLHLRASPSPQKTYWTQMQPQCRHSHSKWDGRGCGAYTVTFRGFLKYSRGTYSPCPWTRREGPLFSFLKNIWYIWLCHALVAARGDLSVMAHNFARAHAQVVSRRLFPADLTPTSDQPKSLALQKQT